MKILMSCRQHPHHLCGGLSIASWNTAKAARDAGHEVLYITGARPDMEHSDIDGIHVHWLKGMSHEADGYPFFYKWLSDNFDNIMKDFEPEILHSQSSALTPLLDRGVPIIFHDHGTMLAAMQDDFNQTAFGQKHTPFYDAKVPYYQMYGQFTNFIEGKEINYLRRFSRVLATSQISAADLRTRYYLTNVRLFYHCIYGIDPAWAAADVLHEPPTVGFFALGLDSPQKSVIFGMKQLLPIKNKIRIKVVGRGNAVPKFAKAHFPHVDVVGYVKEEQAIAELRAMDVLFECSCHHRGTNLTAITALGLGIPVVAYPTSGHMDLVGGNAAETTFGPGGALVDPFDANGAAAAIMHIIQHHSSFSASAAAHFNSRFSPRICAEALNKIYTELT